MEDFVAIAVKSFLSTHDNIDKYEQYKFFRRFKG